MRLGGDLGLLDGDLVRRDGDLEEEDDEGYRGEGYLLAPLCLGGGVLVLADLSLERVLVLDRSPLA